MCVHCGTCKYGADQQVEEQRTPLQLAMDDLAKRLSLFSFGVIGVIFLIGVLQHRGWLEMFTIGGMYESLRYRISALISQSRWRLLPSLKVYRLSRLSRSPLAF